MSETTVIILKTVASLHTYLSRSSSDLFPFPLPLHNQGVYTRFLTLNSYVNSWPHSVLFYDPASYLMTMLFFISFSHTASPLPFLSLPPRSDPLSVPGRELLPVCDGSAEPADSNRSQKASQTKITEQQKAALLCSPLTPPYTLLLFHTNGAKQAHTLTRVKHTGRSIGRTLK